MSEQGELFRALSGLRTRVNKLEERVSSLETTQIEPCGEVDYTEWDRSGRLKGLQGDSVRIERAGKREFIVTAGGRRFHLTSKEKIRVVEC